MSLKNWVEDPVVSSTPHKWLEYMHVNGVSTFSFVWVADTSIHLLQFYSVIKGPTVHFLQPSLTSNMPALIAFRNN